MTVRVFISYAQEDEGDLQTLERCLKPLERQGLIEICHIRKIGAGEEWAGRSRAELDTADIVLLLVSRDFIASDYCIDVEVTRALERHNKGEAVVIPLILRHCTWDWVPFGSLQTLPKDGRPVAKWPDADEFWTEVARGLRVVIDRVDAQNSMASASASIRPAAALPPVGRCLGRDTVVSDLANALLRDSPARIPILGPAGIGKTTVSLAALHRPEVAERFGGRRCFVRLDAVSDADAAAAAIATALRIEPGPDLRGRMLKELARGPTALVLDNLETPWDRDISGTEELLSELAALPSVALLVSIRRADHPGGVTWDRPVHVQPVGENDAVSVFCAIASEEQRNAPQLRPLLAGLAGVPLAIVLLAHAALGNDLDNLADEWEAQRTALLRRGGIAPDRERSWAASLELSLRSPRMTGEGLRLASLLGVLPDGVAQPDLRALLGGAGPGAARVLAQLELAYFEGGRLRMLPPVREHVAAAHPPAGEDLVRAMEHYRELAATLGPRAGATGGAEAVVRLTPEVANLDAVIRRGLEGCDVRRWIDAAVALTDFACVSGYVTPSLLGSALEAATAAEDIWRQATCMESLGNIAFLRSGHEQARVMYEKAQSLHQQVGAVVGEANCIRGLGGIALRRSEHEQARVMFEQAQSLYRQVGSVLGEANCIQSLGDIAFVRSEHEQARAMYEKSLQLYRQVGDVVGEANCIQRLGDIARVRSEHEQARAMYEKAQPLHRQVGDVVGEANCIRGLGDIALYRSEHEQARAMYEAALPLFRQVGDVVGEANCIWGLGDIAFYRLEHEQARAMYEKALPLYRQVGEVLGEANCIKGLGYIALVRSEHEQAKAMYAKALPLYRQVGDVVGEANCIKGLGDIARVQGDVHGARSRYEAALALYARIPEPYSMGQVYHRLARLATDPASRRHHIAAARSAWLSINRPDLVASLDREFPPAPPAA